MFTYKQLKQLCRAGRHRLNIQESLNEPLGESKNTKRYILTVEVDIDALIAAYTGGFPSVEQRSGDTLIQRYDLPTLEQIIEFELEGWLPTSGIHVQQIQEVQK